ncbi:MAG: hypothetical protein WC114_13530 [Smithellaceae bacterium]
MSCNCHGKSGVSVTRTSPFDQCSTCAKKHIVKAWNLFNEFTYTDDNRDVISGQLRLAADHLMYDHRDAAVMARDLAIMIEENRNAAVTTEWDDLLAAVREAFNADHPDAVERLKQLQIQQE